MQQKNIMHYIRICQLKRIIYPLCFLILVSIVFFRLPIVNYLNVSAVDPLTPLSQAVNEKKTYIKTTAKNLYYTGDDYYSDGVLTGHFYYQLEGRYCRIYILKPAAGKPADAYIAEKTVTGRIVKYDTTLDALIEDFAQSLDWTAEGLSGVIDPYAVSEIISFSVSQSVLGAVSAAMMVFGLLSVLYILVLFIFPKLSVTYLRLKGYGNADRILADAEKELSENSILSQDNMTLTPKYLIEFSSDLSAVIPLESVLWVFPTENMRYSLKDHRERMFYSLRIVTIAGDTFIIKDKQKADIDKITDVLSERYPNFFYGYSEEHDRMVHYILDENRRELRENRKQKR